MFNPTFLQTDISDQRQWALASGPGFYTFPHVDGSGLCTWVYLTAGSKIWSYLRPKPEEGRSTIQEFQLKDVYQHYKNIGEASNNYNVAPEKIPASADTYNVFLEPGVLL